MDLPRPQDLRQWVHKLANHHVIVVGDVVLDEYLIGTVQRMSREAPIPVLELQSRRYIAGGAANPAANIVALGSRALQVGVVGDDETAQTLIDQLKTRNIDTSAVLSCDDRPTTLKTRIMAQMGLRFPQQIARIDTLDRTPITRATTTQLLSHITRHRTQSRAIIASDYHNGLLVPQLIEGIQKQNQTQPLWLIADAQGSLDKYHHWHIVKCNAEDASAYLGRQLVTDDDFALGASQLHERLQLREAMVITRGAQGATLAQADRHVKQIPSPHISDVFDTVGAGDTVIAVMALAMIAGASVTVAVMLANYASSIVVRHVGNHTPTPGELLQALST